MSSTKMEIVLAAKDTTARSFSSVEKKISGLKSSVLSLNGLLGAGAAAAGIGYFIKKNLEAADAIAKTADSIGITTTSLQQYNFMAERSGVSADQLNQGFGAFAKRIGELRAGTGALNTYLDKTNKTLKAQLVATHSTDEALNIFLNSLAGVKDQSDKAALSAAAFSRTAGIKLTNLVKGGAESIAGMKKEFKDLGLAIDEKFLRQSEEAVDQFTNLEFVIKSKLMQTVVQFTPEITKVTKAMVDWVTQNEDMLKQNLPKYIKEIKTITVATFGAIKKINGFYMSLPEVVRGPLGVGLIGAALFGPVPGILIGIFASVDQHVDAMQEKLKKLNEQVGGQTFKFPINKNTQGYNLYKKKPVINNSGGNGDLGLEKLAGESSSIVENQEQIAKKLKASRLAAQKDYVDSWESAYRDKDAVQARSIQASIDLEQQTIEDAVENAGAYTDSWITADKEREKAHQRALDELVQQDLKIMQQINDFSTRAFSSMEDAWVSFCINGKTSFKDFANAVIADMLRINFEKGVTEKFQPTVNSWLGKGLGYLFGSSTSSATSSHVGAGGTTAFHMHSGGIAGADTPKASSFMSTAAIASSPRFHSGLLPNEFPAILQKGEGVFTKNQMAAMGKNSAPNIVVQVINNTGTDADVKKEQPKWDGEKWVIGVVLDAMHRNNGFRSNLKSVVTG